MKRLVLILALLPLPAFAQIAVVPFTPPYPLTALGGWSGNTAGSTRQLDAQINKTYAGTVSTVGTAVTYVSGANFVTGSPMVGAIISIAGATCSPNCKVASVSSGTSLTLTSSAGTLTSVAYSLTIQCTAAVGACTINWSATTTGGLTATFSDKNNTAASTISGGLATIQVNISGIAGPCSITPSNTHTGPWTASSTSVVTVTAQSTDDNTKTGTFPINVCANQPATLANSDPSVRVLPFYDQMYPGAGINLQSYVVGCVDETGVWSITAQPGGGNGAFSDSTYRDTWFFATVSGRYTLTYTANCNGGTNFATIYVVPGSAPAYLATPNESKATPCVADPALTGPVYDIGAGHTYATIASTPSFTTVAAGTTYMLYNTDTTGLSPSTYPEYFQIEESGTQVNPIVFCGVPDSLGNLPVWSGNGATGQAAQNASNGTLYGLLSLWVGPSHDGYWQGGSAGPHYVRIAGISFQSANPSTTYTQPGGVSGPCLSGNPAGNQTSCHYDPFTAGIRVQSGRDIVITGIETTTPLGVFSDDNAASSGFYIYTQNIMVDGNNFHNCGWTTAGSHCLYLQSLYVTAQGNRIGPGGGTYYTSGDGPSGLKFRGVELVARYNLFGSALDRAFDLVDVQGGGPYIAMDQYISLMWSGTALSGYDTAGQNVIAAYDESFHKDLAYGNIIPWALGGQLHYGGDTGIYSTANRGGTLYFWNNTEWQSDDVWDNGYSSLSYEVGKFDARNNIFWPNNGVTISSFTRYIDWMLTTTTNLFKTGSISTASNLNGGGGGWSPNDNCSNSGSSAPTQATCPWPLTNPLQTHLLGYTAQYLFTATQPFTATYFTIPSGSAAIAAGTALTGLPAQLPVRFQYNVATNSLVPRSLSDLTLGAEAYSGPGGTTGSTVSGAVISGGTIR